MHWRCVAAALSLLCFELGSSCTGVCTRPASTKQGSTEEYCCPGYSGNPPNCIRLCADLSPPSNGNVSVTTNEVGGTVTYTCDGGFELLGVQNRTCLSNGTWSGLEPICNYTVPCPYPDTPGNGSVTVAVGGPFVRGVAHLLYSCNRGYRPSDFPQRICQPSRQWSGTQPTCIPSCAHDYLWNLPNGHISVTTHDVGGIATYKCNSGYNLSGPSKRTCLSNGFWSGIKPTCNHTVVCPTLDHPNNGSVKIESSFYGGRAYYSCNPGYQQSHYSSRYCQLSGSWSGTQPTCIRACSTSSFKHGYVSVITRTVGGRATYTCNSGFRLVGSPTRTCLSDGNWSGSEPICNYTLSVFCPDLDHPSNGSVSVSSNYVGETVYYRCNYGYELSSYSSRTCQQTGEWSGIQPTCIRTCHYLSSPRYGRVSVPTRGVGGSATYTCISGFRLVGSSTRTCLSDGSWSGSQPFCNYTLTVLCPDLDQPSNGSVTVDSNFVGESAYYRCNYGYRLSGPWSRTCQLSGDWSRSQPTCIRVCNYLSYPNHGRVSVSTCDVGGRATYTCNSGFRLIGSSTRTCLSDGSWSGTQPTCDYTLSVLCPNLDHPDNGSVSVSFNYVGESAYYRCNYGYRLSGSSYRTCLLSGKWSGTQPTCIRVCSYLNSPRYGRVSVTTRDVGGRATYTCNSGFRLIGLSTRTCLSDGIWSGSEPICNYTLAILCPTLNDPDNGSVSVSSSRYVGERAYYSCDYGYQLLGSFSRTCQLSGYWSGTQPTCIRSCGYLSSPRYGRVSVTTRGVGGNATYTCNSGFRLVGLSTRTCLSNGSWSGSQPVCNATVVCPSLDDPSNGSVSVSYNFVGGRAYYSCSSGYRRSHYSSRRCQLSGTWSGTQPTCIRSCSYLSSPRNGRVSVTTRDVGGRATYTCNSGFRLVGSSPRTCLSNGNWSGSEPICNYTLAILCPTLNDPDNGSVSVSSSRYVGERAYYSCDYGYQLLGSFSRTCQLSGDWSGTQPTCIRSCGYLSSPRYGRVSVTTRGVGGRATYTCNSGFRLVGLSTRTCLSNGSWSGSQPICNATVVCPSLDDPSNGSVSVSYNFVGGRAYYSCNSGYRRSHYSSRRCQLSGTWSGTQPTCIRSCSYLSSPRYGRVSVTTRDVGGRATYTCNSGFKLIGSSIRTCLSNGSWSGSQPICNHTVLCPNLDDPSNGSVSVSYNFVGGRAYYSCNSGYRLSHYSSRRCQLSGTWSGTQPTCIRACSYLSSPRYGRVSVTTRDVGGRATYTCNNGFRLVGSSTRTCLSEGSWSGSQPICNYTVKCPSLESPGNGSISVNHNFVGGRARYRCNYRYQLSGPSSRTCQLSGNWSGIQPRCLRGCSSLYFSSYSDNGRVSVSAYFVGGTATYTCNSGYRLSGSSTRTCLSDGSWSGSKPTCNRVTCPSPDPPGNGSVSVSSSYYSTRASYSCNSGYGLVGSSSRTCLSSGSWSGTQPQCVRRCSYLSSPRYGRVSVTTRNAGGRATYTCNSGFRLIQGSFTRTCLSDGSWSGSQPICYRGSCPYPDRPGNGSVSVSSSSYSTRASYRCNSGYGLVGSSSRTCLSSGSWSGTQPTCVRRCSYLSSPRYGHISVTTRNVGGRATYTCNNGFRLVGSSTLTCLSNGSWSGSQPICNYTVLCPNLDNPSKGSVSVRSNFVGGRAYYYCNSGYRRSGSSSRTCQLSGRWSGTQPTCIRVCNYLSSPRYGRVFVPTRNVGGSATYTCNSGFRLVGLPTRTCLSDGSWSGSQPICNYTVRCPSLESPGNGSISVNHNFVGGRARYRCNYRYQLSGPSSRTCQLSGNWSGQQPRCLRRCSSLYFSSYSDNGRVSVSAYFVGGTATYTCNSGYRLSGSSTRTCLSDGIWSGSEPTCNRVTCPSLDRPGNGSVSVSSSRASYRCNSGYVLVGSSSRTCLSSGTWSGTQPTCVKRCSYLSSPRYGRVSVTTRNAGGRATYTCNSGFRLVGLSTRICLSDGSWSGSQPICYGGSCPYPDHPGNGSVSVSSSYYGTRASYSCNSGYGLVGTSSRTCLSSGSWSGTQPTCVRRCSYLSSPRYGRVSVTTRNVGGRATYTCNSGFRLVGSSTRTCLSDGSWSASQPICNATVMCPSLDRLGNGSVSVSSNFVGGRAYYRCNYGYQLSGYSSRTCQLSGEWSRTQPTCVRRCSYLSSPRYGRVSVATRTVGDRATYTCNSGFRLVGSSTRTCLSDGSWSGSQPICNATVLCPSLNSPGNGSLSLISNFVGERARYRCNYGYRLSGYSSRTCQLSGEWTGTQPTCIRRCSSLYFSYYSDNGRVSVTTSDVGGRATYTCNSGFRLIGSSTRTCLSDGNWSGSEPICYRGSCPYPDRPGNGSVSVSSSFYSTRASYRCNSGYGLVGSSSRTCSSSGSWSGTQPTCVKRCSYLSSPRYGRVSVTTRNAGGRATYTCNSGFRLVQGSSNRTCLSDGSWSGSKPVCYKGSCPYPDPPGNGSVSVSSSSYSTIASYSCNSGYGLVGTSSRTCLSSGTWSGTQPTCIRRCSYLSYPRYGRVSVTTRNAGGRATYTCNSGFILVGSSTRTCLSEGSWSGSQPICNATVTCPNLDRLGNGSVSVSSNFVGGRAYYRCNSGYRLSGYSSRSCRLSGEWTGTQPTCIRRCSSLYFSPYSNHGRVSVTTRDVGGRATYTCNSGYRLVGSSTRTCLSDGSWSGSRPTCQRVRCPSINAPGNGSVVISSFYYNGVANYSCSQNYYLVGYSQRTCHQDGNWTRSQPICVPFKPDDEIQVGFVQSSISVAENVGRVDICVTVLKSPSHLVPNINLEVSTLDYGDARSSLDFAAETGYPMLLSAQNQTTCYSQRILDNSMPQSDRNFSVLLRFVNSNKLPITVTVLRRLITVRILDDDGIVAGFESSSTSILESEGSGTVCVVSRFSQSHNSSQFTLIVDSRPGTAETESDYTSINGVKLGPFSAISTRHCLTVSVIKDNTTERNETLILSLSLKSDLLYYIIFNRQTTLIKIIDDDTETSEEDPPCTYESDWSPWTDRGNSTVPRSVCSSTRAVVRMRERNSTEVGCDPEVEYGHFCVPTQAEQLIRSLGLGSQPIFESLAPTLSPPTSTPAHCYSAKSPKTLSKNSDCGASTYWTCPYNDKPYQSRQAKRCERRSLLFMLDSSGSIRSTNFQKIIHSVATMGSTFCGEAEFALLKFSDSISLEFCFDCYPHSVKGREDFSARVYDTTYSGGFTHTGAAVSCARNFMFKDKCGFNMAEDRCIDIVLFTDGKSNGGYDVCDQIDCLHKSPIAPNLRVHAIAVGNAAQDELACIREHTTYSDEDYSVFNFKNITSLLTALDEVQNKILGLGEADEIDPLYDCAAWVDESLQTGESLALRLDL